MKQFIADCFFTISGFFDWITESFEDYSWIGGQAEELSEWALEIAAHYDYVIQRIRAETPAKK